VGDEDRDDGGGEEQWRKDGRDKALMIFQKEFMLGWVNKISF
jgi:hypothetical protein